MKKQQKGQEQDQPQKRVKTLKIHKETLTRLESAELRLVAGLAAGSDASGTRMCCHRI